MQLAALLSLLALTATSIAERSRCGAHEPHDALVREAEAQEMEERMMDIASDFPQGSSKGSSKGNTKGHIEVTTYAHIVTTMEHALAYTFDQVKDQLSILNDAYDPHGIVFNHINTSYTVSDTWGTVTDSTTTELRMKRSLRRGTYADLNLYFIDDLSSGSLLGICYFPDDISEGAASASGPNGEHTLELDGCMIAAGSLPGGDAENFNMGGTAVHETGHWFGLMHPFQGSSCGAPGDHIGDTPRQRTATSGCPRVKDSCPGFEGGDSVHNYMDYSYDACYTEFTPGQQRRAHNMYNKYRAEYAC